MPPESSLYKCASWLVLAMLLISGCAPTRTRVRINDYERYGSLFYQKTYDEYGRPVFLLLSDRPAGKGVKFHAVGFENNRPSVSYEIEVIDEPEKNILKPAATLLTGLVLTPICGLVLGVMAYYDEATDNDYDTTCPECNKNDPDEAFNAGFAIGTVGCLLFTIYSTGEESVKLVTNKNEVVISETYYSYDDMDRLKGMITMPPPGDQWKSRSTKFFYEGEGTVPFRTETDHHPAESPNLKQP